MGYIKQGSFMLITGTVSGRDARYKEFESGSRVADFSVCYDHVSGDEPGRKKGQYIDVKCWRDLSDYARYLEKGDRVLVTGVLTKDKKPDQDGNDRWYLNADFCSAQPQIQIDDGGVEFEEDAATDDPLPEEFGGTNTEYGGGDYPEALE